MLLPASTGSRSEERRVGRECGVLTAVASIEEMSEVSGSNTPEVVLAVLEMLVVREESTFTTRVTDLLAPEVIVVRFQPTTPAEGVPPTVAETKLVSCDITSDMFTADLSDGPLFVTVSV